MLERIRAFQAALQDRIAARREPFEHGVGLFVDELPDVWDMNFLRVVRPAAPEALMESAERLHAAAGQRHRQLDVHDPALGVELEPDFVAAGWKSERHLVMVRRRALDRAPARVETREVSDDELEPGRELGIRSEVVDERVVRQLLEGERRRSRLIGARHFAAFVDERPASYCSLYSDGETAQIEAVMTLAEYRGRGLARAVVTHALDEAAGHSLVFLTADPDDWPWRLYEKLGFDRVGVYCRFRRVPAGPGRTPPPDRAA